jgi:hypothetical protein
MALEPGGSFAGQCRMAQIGSRTMNVSNFLRALTLATGIAALTATAATSQPAPPRSLIDSTAAIAASQTFIVQAHSADEAARLVLAAGGKLLSPLPLINAVGAELDASQLARLQSQAAVHVYRDRRVETAGTKSRTSSTK